MGAGTVGIVGSNFKERLLPLVMGFLLLASSLIYVPAGLDALNYFDPPKRLIWGFMALVLAICSNTKNSRLGPSLVGLSLALVAWMTARTLFRPYPWAEIEVLMTWSLPLLLFVWGGSLDRERGAKMIGCALLIAACIQASLMLLQRWGLDPLFAPTTSALDYHPARMVGTIGYHNQAVDFIVIALAGIFLIAPHTKWHGAIMAPFLAIAVLAGHRTGIAAFAGAIAISQIARLWTQPGMSRRVKWRVAVGVGVAAFGLAVAVMSVSDTGRRFREVITQYDKSASVNSRIAMARIGLKMMEEKPWVGWGAGEYALQYLDRMGRLLPEQKTHDILQGVVYAREAHNDYIQFMAEFGAVGLVLALALMGTAVVRLMRPGRDIAQAIPLLYIAVYMSLSALLSFPWQTSMCGPLAGLLLGLFWPSQKDFSSLGARSTPMGHSAPAHTVLRVGLVAVAVMMGIYWSLDSYWNIAVPHALATDSPDAALRRVPHLAYRYRAIIGAAEASVGNNQLAERLLLDAQRGYRDVALWNNLGSVQAALDKWADARDTYETWARSGLDYPSALLNLSVAYERLENRREAARCLAIKNSLWNQPPPEEIKRLAALYIQLGNPEKAQKTIRRYYRAWKNADARTAAEMENMEGVAWLLSGDGAAAERCFRAALERYPGLESARLNLERFTGARRGPSPHSDK